MSCLPPLKQFVFAAGTAALLCSCLNTNTSFSEPHEREEKNKTPDVFDNHAVWHSPQDNKPSSEEEHPRRNNKEERRQEMLMEMELESTNSEPSDNEAEEQPATHKHRRKSNSTPADAGTLQVSEKQPAALNSYVGSNHFMSLTPLYPGFNPYGAFNILFGYYPWHKGVIFDPYFYARYTWGGQYGYRVFLSER